MKRALGAVVLAGLLTGVVGCGGSAVPEPVVPAQSVTQTQVPRRHERRLPRLIAPPPAYGNKVVMARAQSSDRLN